MPHHADRSGFVGLYANRTRSSRTNALPPPRSVRSLSSVSSPNRTCSGSWNGTGRSPSTFPRGPATEIKLKVLLRYGNIINNFMSEGLDGAFFRQLYLHDRPCPARVKVIARPEDLDGRSTYHGVIFTRRDSGIRTIADMRGKRLPSWTRRRLRGYLVPLAYFRTQGIDHRTYLREDLFCRTHERRDPGRPDRKADAGAAKNTVFERPIGANRRSVEGLRWCCGRPRCRRTRSPSNRTWIPRWWRRFRSLLLSMHGDPEGAGVLAVFKARRFIATTDADYRPVYRSIREAGIDPATYDYLNE